MRALTVIFAVSLAGCSSGIGYVASNYGMALPTGVTTRADSWWVFDKPPEGKILVQRNPAGAAGEGFGAGFIGKQNAAAPKPLYQEAAEQHLAQDGRRCRIKDGYVVADVSWEFAYECEPATGSIARR